MTDMSPQERQEFFRINGYWPTRYVHVEPRPKKLSTTPKSPFSPRAALALRGWKAPLHWMVPPAFENPREAYELLGHEAFCEQVESYYAFIRDRNVERAQLAHARWAVRACLRTFEGHVRGFRRQDVGRGGSLFNTASDELVLPETLIADGRLVHDLKDYLRAYGVRPQDRLAAERLFKTRLAQRWGVEV